MTTTTYELWHAASGNFLEDFESEGEALAAVGEYLEANGPELVEDLALGVVPSTGLTIRAETPPFLRGAPLLARVQATAQPTAPPMADVVKPVKPTRQAGMGLKPASETPQRQIEPLKAAVESLGDEGGQRRSDKTDLPRLASTQLKPRRRKKPARG